MIQQVMEIKSKLWIEINGEPVFGEGRKILLQAIADFGSINQAAKETNISYRRAWSYIKFMEERLAVKLVERRAGGKHGGGASLTGAARELIEKYERLQEGIDELVDKKFNRIFGDQR